MDSRIDRVEASLSRRLDDIGHKLTQIAADQAAIREKLARLEERLPHEAPSTLWSPQRRAR
jgi:hypothetical protein